jgi:hypothetical protein
MNLRRETLFHIPTIILVIVITRWYFGALLGLGASYGHFLTDCRGCSVTAHGVKGSTFADIFSVL